MNNVSCIKVNIYKHIGQSFSMNGISERYNDAFLIVDDGHIQINLDDLKNCSYPILRIKVRSIGGEIVLSAVVLHDPDRPDYNFNSGKSEMMGGCFIYLPDSRFRNQLNFYGAVALHDRYEKSLQRVLVRKRK